MAKTNETLLKMKSILENENLGEKAIYYIISSAYQYVCNNNLINSKDDELLAEAKKMNEYLSLIGSEKIDSLYEELEIEDIRNLIYNLISEKNNDSKSFIGSSNNYICELVIDLLDINESGQIIMDFGSGMGNFLANVYKKAKDKKIALNDLIGIELNREQVSISKMALLILSDDSISPKIIFGNALEKTTYQYTKAYVFPPIGMRKLLNDNYRRSFLFSDICLSNKNSSEWLFIDNMLSGLIGDRAVALVSGKALFNNADIEYRNKLISSGWLEGIIELPAGSLSFTGIKIFLLVFSRNNEKVKFVDASNVIEVENKRYINLELPVKKIEDMYYSKDVNIKTFDDLIDKQNLCPSTILVNLKKFENGVELKELSEIFNGSQYTLGVFEKKGLISNQKTGYRILTAGDIENGMIQWELLRSIDMNNNKFDKFAVHYGDVIVTSKSSKIKTAVVDIEPNEKILATGGLIIIRPNLDKLNPTYLKMFFDSQIGQSALKNVQKGSVIVTLTSNGLSSIKIPVIDIKKQQEKARRYNDKLSTLAAYKQEIENIENSLKNIFEEEEE